MSTTTPSGETAPRYGQLDPPSADPRLVAIIEKMLDAQYRWGYRYGSTMVIYADKIDEWADELSTLLHGDETGR
jgi:hypothetical protein